MTNVISSLMATTIGAFRCPAAFSNLIGGFVALTFALFSGFLFNIGSYHDNNSDNHSGSARRGLSAGGVSQPEGGLPAGDDDVGSWLVSSVASVLFDVIVTIDPLRYRLVVGGYVMF